MIDDEKRTNSIRVRLTPGQRTRLDLLSKRMGVPSPTLLAIAAGRYLDEEWSRIQHLDSLYGGDFYQDEEGNPVLGEDGEPVRRDA